MHPTARTRSTVTHLPTPNSTTAHKRRREVVVRPALPAEHEAADIVVESGLRADSAEHSLPVDIWFFIAQTYLLDSLATLAALSSTNRHFHALLRPLKFRAVTVRLELSSVTGIVVAASKPKRGGNVKKPAVKRLTTKAKCKTTAKTNTSTSAALRFAQFIQSEPDIIRHIQVLWIGHEEEVRLRAIDDESNNDSERRSLCYILSSQYPNLKHLVLSFRYATINRRFVPMFPAPILRSVVSALSLPSLSEVSILMHFVPLKVYTLLLQCTHMDTFNIRAGTINHKGFGFSPPMRQIDSERGQRNQLRTLRMDTSEGMTINTLFPTFLSVLINSPRLDTLVLKSTIFQASFHLHRIPSTTLVNLKLYFISWLHVPGYNFLNLKAFSALRSLTLGFSLTSRRPSGSETPGRRQLEWNIDVLRTIKPDQPLEYINLFIDDLDSSIQGWDEIDQLPWSDLQNLFSAGSLQLQWPTLQRINIGFQASSDKAFEPSDRALMEKALRPGLGLLLDSGILRLHVPIFGKSVFFDDFWSTMRCRT